MMMMRRSTLGFALGLTGLLCGCATTGYHRASETRSVILNVRAETAKLQHQLEATSSALQTLTGSEAAALRPLYDNFSAAVSTLDTQASRLPGRGRAVQESGDAYLKQWQKELTDYKSSEVRSVSTDRRSAVTDSFRRVNEQFRSSEDSLRPLLSDLKDLRRYLSTDLTAAGINSARELVGRIYSQATNAQQNLQSLLAELDRAADELAPMK
jgi:hypothetical protein